MANLTKVGIGSAADDGNGDPLRTAFGALNGNVDYLLDMFARMRSFNGFDREDTTTLGLIQYCHDASSGEVHQIDEDGTYTKLTSQTQFADASTALADRTLAQYHSSGETDFKYWNQGTLVENAGIKTVQLTDDSNPYFIGYNSSGNLAAISSTHDAIVDSVLVAFVSQNAVTGQLLYLADERHGLIQSGQTHLTLHSVQKFGFSWCSGAEISGLANNATTHTGITEGYFYDENIYHHIPAASTIPWAYKTGANGEWTITAADNRLGVYYGGKYCYNEWDGSTWQLSEINSDYVGNVLLATNNAIYPYIWICGQTLYSSRSVARDHMHSLIADILLDDVIRPEVAPLYSVIVNSESSGTIEKGNDDEIYIDLKWGVPGFARF